MKTYNYEKYTVTEERISEEFWYCDVCKKLIYKRSIKDNSKNKNSVSFWELTTGHNDWGNDSCDSVESFALCSEECAKVKFVQYLEDSAEGRNTMYFEIQRQNDFGE